MEFLSLEFIWLLFIVFFIALTGVLIVYSLKQRRIRRLQNPKQDYLKKGSSDEKKKVD